jgi:DeoR family transcriptional regulator, fructose operon transcriptional repressor
MSKKELRVIRLLEMLQVHKRIDVKTVASSLSISEATVRRLFAELEEQGKVLRVHGGVQLAPPLNYDYSYRLSTQHKNREKTAIGDAAAEVIEDHDRIFLDSGTTVIKLAEALSLKLQSGKLKNIVVLTNSLNLIDTLANWCKVILIGGEIRVERRDVCGVISEKSLSFFRVNKAFLGADGVDVNSGCMATDELTAKMNEIVISRSEKIFVLADSEKFNRNSFVSYTELEKIDRIYTDSNLDGEILSQFKEQEIDVYTVP